MSDPAADHALTPELPGATVSIVQLQRQGWVVTNTDDPSISHHGEWLPDILGAHRHAITFRLHQPLALRYQLGPDDTAERIDHMRTVGEHVAALRRQAAHAEAAIRADRVRLMRELAGLRVAPGEIALILGVPTTAVPKDLGTDQDARLARSLHSRPAGVDDPEDSARLF